VNSEKKQASQGMTTILSFPGRTESRE